MATIPDMKVEVRQSRWYTISNWVLVVALIVSSAASITRCNVERKMVKALEENKALDDSLIYYLRKR